jgi:hypothetical protein
MLVPEAATEARKYSAHGLRRGALTSTGKGGATLAELMGRPQLSANRPQSRHEQEYSDGNHQAGTIIGGSLDKTRASLLNSANGGAALTLVCCEGLLGEPKSFSHGQGP